LPPRTTAKSTVVPGIVSMMSRIRAQLSAANLVPNEVMSQLDPSQHLRPFERRFLGIGEIRAFSPTREAIKALVWFSCGSQISRRFVDTVRATVDLRYAEEKKIP
jgi:hypothetical protein